MSQEVLPEAGLLVGADCLVLVRAALSRGFRVPASGWLVVSGWPGGPEAGPEGGPDSEGGPGWSSVRAARLSLASASSGLLRLEDVSAAATITVTEGQHSEGEVETRRYRKREISENIESNTGAHTHTHTRTQTHMHARTNAHTHTHTHTII